VKLASATTIATDKFTPQSTKWTFGPNFLLAADQNFRRTRARLLRLTIPTPRGSSAGFARSACQPGMHTAGWPVGVVDDDRRCLQHGGHDGMQAASSPAVVPPEVRLRDRHHRRRPLGSRPAIAQEPVPGTALLVGGGGLATLYQWVSNDLPLAPAAAQGSGATRPPAAPLRRRGFAVSGKRKATHRTNHPEH